METSQDETATSPEKRKWWEVPFIVIGILILASPIVLATVNENNDDGDEIANIASTTTSTIGSTTTSTSTITTSTLATTAVTATTAAVTTATTVPAAACRNSTSPSCGAFRWDPDPVNRPITIEVRWDVASPRAGEQVVFHVAVSDPDASPIKEGACGTSTGMAFGDGPAIPTTCGTACPTTRYGPWSPPAPARGAANFDFPHVYAQPGTYTATVAFASGDRCGSPYASVNHLTFNITITE